MSRRSMPIGGCGSLRWKVTPKSGFPEETLYCRRLIVVAGDDYVDPLLERDMFEPFPWETRFPFKEQDFAGTGEQMAWLSEQADRYADGDQGQAALTEEWEMDREQADLDVFDDYDGGEQ